MHLFKTKKDNKIYAPVTGMMIPLSEVPDNTFASGMMGNGFAFRFDSDMIFSPCFGEVLVIAKTRHAVGIKMENGAEILLHIGLDTVMLNGKGFILAVKKGQKIRPGTELLKIDRKIMHDNHINMISMLIITNSSEFSSDINIKEQMQLKEVLFEIGKK